MDTSHRSKDCEEKAIAKINLSLGLVRKVEESLSKRCLVGLMFRPRPRAVEQLRKWMEEKWQSMDVMVEDVEVLSKGHCIFRFQNRKTAMDILDARQWMYGRTPFCFFSCSKEFSASGPKSSKCPVWVELPDLPYHFFQWTDKIASLLGKVFGSRKRAFINPSWHPQILVEIDLEKPLMEEIFISCGE